MGDVAVEPGDWPRDSRRCDSRPRCLVLRWQNTVISSQSHVSTVSLASVSTRAPPRFCLPAPGSLKFSSFSLLKQEFLSLGRQLSYKVLYFLCNETKVWSIPSTHTRKLGVLVHTCNSCPGEADGGLLGCQSTQWVLGQWETYSPDQGGWLLRDNTEVDLWSPSLCAHICLHTHEHTPIPTHTNVNG